MLVITTMAKRFVANLSESKWPAADQEEAVVVESVTIAINLVTLLANAPIRVAVAVVAEEVVVAEAILVRLPDEAADAIRLLAEAPEDILARLPGEALAHGDEALHHLGALAAVRLLNIDLVLAVPFHTDARMFVRFLDSVRIF